MRNMLLTLAATCALFVGGLTWTDTAEARPWRYYYRAPVTRYYGYRPSYYSYQPSYYGYRSYYGYPYYSGYTYGYPYYYGTPYFGSRVYYRW
jgi:hypothetical protein